MDSTIAVGGLFADALMVGDMGVKSIFVGDTHVYERPGGYFYIEFET